MVIKEDVCRALKALVDAVESETEHTGGPKDWDLDCPICVSLREARTMLALAEIPPEPMPKA